MSQPLLKVALDRRDSSRHRVECPGWLDFGDGLPPHDCTVWDMSDGGARIEVDGAAEVPAEFFLSFTRDGSVGRLCQVIWRTESQIGARYLKTPGL